MCTIILVAVLSTLNLASLAEAAKILCIFPIPFLSHQIVFRTLTHELAKRGHEMTIVTTHPEYPEGESPENYTEINVTYDMNKYLLCEDPEISAIKNIYVDPISLMKELHKPVHQQLKSIKNTLETYDRDHFDLIILEGGLKSFLVWSHIFNAPLIRMSPIGRHITDYEDIGAPTHPILYPYMNQPRLYNLTLWDKLSVYFEYFKRQFIIIPKLIEMSTQDLKEVFGEDIPSDRELNNNIDLLIIHTHQIWEGNVPVPPNVIHVWGLNLKPKNDLPVDIEKLINSSAKGVIYMNFGSILKISHLPKHIREAILKALSRMPHDVLLKWENDELPDRPKNVHIRKWWPQTDLLRHPKVKLFINHGGLLSTYEAIIGGVPVISIPIFGDHYSNAEKCVHHKIGVQLDLMSITEDNFLDALKTVVYDDSYRRNIIKLRSLMLDQPESSLDRAVWWIEYVIRHGGAKHLRSPAANMSWAQYYDLDLVLIILGSFIVTCILVVLCLFMCLPIVLRRFGCKKTIMAAYAKGGFGKSEGKVKRN